MSCDYKTKSTCDFFSASKKDVRFSETRDSSRGGLVSASSTRSSQSTQPLSIQGLGFKEETKGNFFYKDN